MSNDDQLRTVYELIELMSSLNDTRRAILLALSHIYPKSVSGVQLSRLIGYSGKSRSLYRGVLSQMQDNIYAIRVNNEHPLLKILVDMCRKYGDEARKIYEKSMEE
ncbi:MAG: hypothetical protein ACXAEJ_16855 [Candidatus Thorarchaeota archaeon]|jgi:hypothetical protein